jgi:hypothetical protein
MNHEGLAYRYYWLWWRGVHPQLGFFSKPLLPASSSFLLALQVAFRK